LLKNAEGTLTVHAARGLPGVRSALGYKIPVREGGRFIRCKKRAAPLIFGQDDGIGAFHELIGLPLDHSCLGAPLIARDELIGFLSVEQIEPMVYTPDDAQVVFALAGQAALAISNARLYEAERRAGLGEHRLAAGGRSDDARRGVDQVLSTVVRITPMLSAWTAAPCCCGMEPRTCSGPRRNTASRASSLSGLPVSRFRPAAGSHWTSSAKIKSRFASPSWKVRPKSRSATAACWLCH